jgi:toxin YoeB
MSERRDVVSTHFVEDLEHWVATDRKVALRLLRIVRETLRDPYAGVGKPEPLRRQLSGLWSRRLTQEHRVVYQPTDTTVFFLQARYHY